jgi:hypothetical protein
VQFRCALGEQSFDVACRDAREILAAIHCLLPSLEASCLPTALAAFHRRMELGLPLRTKRLLWCSKNVRLGGVTGNWGEP